MIRHKFSEIMKYITETSNPVLFKILQMHNNTIYEQSEDTGKYQLKLTDDKIINLLFDMVQGLDAQYQKIMMLVDMEMLKMKGDIVIPDIGDERAKAYSK